MSQDLNYRIDLPDSEIREFLSEEQREFDTLLAYDQVRFTSCPLIYFNFIDSPHFHQLATAIRRQHAFFGFSEHPIDFLPYVRINFGGSILT